MVGHRIFRYEDEDVERSRFHSLLNETQAMFTASFFSDYFPFIGGWIDKLSGLSSRLERLFKDMDEFYEEIINDHLDPGRPKSEHQDIVDVLLQLRKERCFSFDLTLDHIKAILMVSFAQFNNVYHSSLSLSYLIRSSEIFATS